MLLIPEIRRQGAQSTVEQLGQGEMRRRGGDFQDRAMRAGDIGGAVSTRREVPGAGDVSGARRRKKHTRSERGTFKEAERMRRRQDLKQIPKETAGTTTAVQSSGTN